MHKRFTIDGSDELELRLARTCESVASEVCAAVAPRDLVAIALGGGYGRGEGGVWRTEAGDQPYNDLEFYVFMRGNCLWQDRKYKRALEEIGNRLSRTAGLHVEFKVYSPEKLRGSPVSMFSYDLVAGHRLVFGGESVFDGCAHHLDASQIPLSEATRLLFNRCSGLLLASEMLRREELTSDEADFIGRNLAKAELALGDVVLTAFGQYHMSARERNRRLRDIRPPEALLWLGELQKRHARGLEFKMHPSRSWKTRDEFAREHRDVCELARQVWLWLENRRLNQRFQSPRDYALSGLDKCPDAPAWRNYLLTLRTFGLRGALDSLACRYPRTRLLNALVLLLWHGGEGKEPQIVRRLQRELRTSAEDRPGFISAYQQIWSSYG
jgi:hypothetical protein